MIRHPLRWSIVAVAALGVAGGLYWFQPWKLATDNTVNEVLPSAVASPGVGASSQPEKTCWLRGRSSPMSTSRAARRS